MATATENRMATPKRLQPLASKPGSRRHVPVSMFTSRSKGDKSDNLEPTSRLQQPVLEKEEIDAYHNSARHQLSVEMLERGCHRAFTEMFELVKRQQKRIVDAGPDAVFLGESDLDEKPEKLTKLKDVLINAEEAERECQYVDVYKAYLDLAQYFQQTGDKWIADHFYMKALHASAKITTDGGQKRAEAFRNTGLAFEAKNDLANAASHLEEFYHLSSGKFRTIWVDSEGRLYFVAACEFLARVYISIARQRADEPAIAVDYLEKAYEKAKESGEKKLEADCSYKLGLGFEKCGRSETALFYLRNYHTTCSAWKDYVGLGFACEAIAKSFESLNQTDDCIKTLQEFIDIADRTKQEEAYSRACCQLGTVLNSLGKYEQACDYFNKAYTLARARNDNKLISSSRVQFGIAQAHKMYDKMLNHCEMQTKLSLKKIVDWKNVRTDQFAQSVQDAKPRHVSDEKPANEAEITDLYQDADVTEPFDYWRPEAAPVAAVASDGKGAAEPEGDSARSGSQAQARAPSAQAQSRAASAKSEAKK